MICQLLLQEADAWRALLALFTTTVSQSRRVVGESNDAEASHAMADETREAAYNASITGLASSADALVTELLRLRSLRVARRRAEVSCYKAALRIQTNEVLATGRALCVNGAVDVGGVVAELRAACTRQRNHVQQLELLLEMHAAHPVDLGSRLVVGVQTGGEPPRVAQFDDVVAAAIEAEREATASTVSAALRRLLVQPPPESPLSPSSKATKQRQFERKKGDRD
tara:strand:- start:298 stop:975 length:678 start_codon:yes stop_codon:yes gene_type:complete